MSGRTITNETSGLLSSAVMESGWSCLPFQPVTTLMLPVVDSSARRTMALLDQDRKVDISLPVGEKKSLLPVWEAYHYSVWGRQYTARYVKAIHTNGR